MTPIPRSEWFKHPNFPSQALLLGSHDNFRQLSEHLVRESMRSWALSSKAPPAQDLIDLFVRWKQAMKGHEGYEEGKLYPFLEARFDTSMDGLKEEHRDLSVATAKVYGAIERRDALAFAHTLKKHDQVLLSHLGAEEDAVVPLLLSLNPAEFRHYYNSTIGELLRSRYK